MGQDEILKSIYDSMVQLVGEVSALKEKVVTIEKSGDELKYFMVEKYNIVADRIDNNDARVKELEVSAIQEKSIKGAYAPIRKVVWRIIEIVLAAIAGVLAAIFIKK